MERYESYKPTGIEWIGDIPNSWSVKKLKYLVDLVDEPNPLAEFVIAVENIEGKTGKLVNLDPDKTFQGEIKAFKKGDVLFNKLRPYLAKVYYAEDEGGSIGELLTLRIKDEIVGRYLFYRTLSANFIDVVDSSTNGTKMPRASWDGFINQLPIPFPDKPEQEAIAKYLDRKTEEVDKLIANKQKLIELLKEERTAIINKAVTKGINPDAKLKPSGVDWLSDIPEHWEIKKLKYFVSKVGSGVTPLGGATVYRTEGVPLLRSQNIYSDSLVLDDVAYITEEIDESMSNSRIEEGDVLLNITGASLGRCFYVPKGFGRGNVNQHVCIIRPHSSLMNFGYLHSVLISGYGQNLIEMCQMGANREGLNFQQIRNFSLPYCDIDEQEKIVEFIDEKSQAVNRTISKVEKEIELMREYRTALISEVVTGKVKVV